VTLDPKFANLERSLREQIAESAGQLIGQGYQATVYRYESPVGAVVIKSPHPSWLLGFFGRLAIRREDRVYERLAGTPGIPRRYGLLDGRHLVLEAIAGPSYRAQQSRLENRERFFARLLETLEAMHAAGVAHADLKRKDNLIVGPDEQPFLIDFGIACLDGAQQRGWQHIKFEWFRQLDLNAWIKLKYGRRPVSMSAEDEALYRPLWLERIARVVRIGWQKLTFRRAREQRRRRSAGRG
jgi:predicted Ser/Thr protein kinase